MVHRNACAIVTVFTCTHFTTHRDILVLKYTTLAIGPPSPWEPPILYHQGASMVSHMHVATYPLPSELNKCRRRRNSTSTSC